MKVSDSMIRVSQIKISIDDPIEKVKELLLKQEALQTTQQRLFLLQK